MTANTAPSVVVSKYLTFHQPCRLCISVTPTHCTAATSTAGRKFVPGSDIHGNENRPSWIEGAWSPARDLDECASHGSNGSAFRRSRGGGTLRTIAWVGRGAS